MTTPTESQALAAGAHAPLVTIVDNQLWSVPHTIRLGPGIYLPARMTIIRLDAESLALHSPVPLTAAQLDAIRAIGRVTTIIAPNNFHHLYLRPAIEAFPDADVWAAPGLPAKRPKLALRNLLGPDAKPPFADRLTPIFLAGGPKMDETVFLHRATRTLVVTDSYFHLKSTTGWLTPLVFRLTGSLKPGQSRIWRSTVKDRQAMAAASRAVAALDFDRIVMAHGEVLHSGGKAAWVAATAWLVPG
jgi:hypothetical protein